MLLCFRCDPHICFKEHADIGGRIIPLPEYEIFQHSFMDLLGGPGDAGTRGSETGGKRNGTRDRCTPVSSDQIVLPVKFAHGFPPGSALR